LNTSTPPVPRIENNVKGSNKLLEAALFFHERYGLIVAPFQISKDGNGKFKKRPLIAKGLLEKWLKDGQSIEEVKKLNWQESNGVGVFLSKTVDNLYLCCVDIDTKEDFWRPLLKYLPVTKFERTPRDGLHAFYFSEQKPRAVSVAISDKERIELLFNKWVVIHPSEGYSKLNDSSIRVVEDVYRIFMDFIFDCGFDECIPKNNEDSNVDEKEGARSLAKYLQMVENFLQPYLAYSGHGYKLYRCVFHPPDNHPSLLLNLKKGYVFDFHDGKAYSLKKFLEQIGALTSGEKREKSPVIEKLADVVKRAGAIEYYSKPLIPKSALLLLCGFAGAGKSMLTLDIALKLAEGKSMWGCFDSTQTNVLLVDLENPLTLIKERCQFLSDNGIPENIFFYSGEFFLDRKDDVEKLEKIVMDKKINLIIIDNLSCLFKNIKENDNLRIYLLLKRLRDICLKHGATCIIVHHLRKQQMFVSANPLDEIRGSSTIAGIADMVLYLQKVQDFFQLKIVKNRLANVFDSYLLELDVGGFKLLQKDMQGLAGDRLSAVIRHIESVATSMPNGIFMVKNVSESSPFTHREIYQGLQFLQGIGKVRRLKRGLYQYVLQTLLTSNEDLDYSE
jgi:hypothetical protein